MLEETLSCIYNFKTFEVCSALILVYNNTNLTLVQQLIRVLLMGVPYLLFRTDYRIFDKRRCIAYACPQCKHKSYETKSETKLRKRGTS